MIIALLLPQKLQFFYEVLRTTIFNEWLNADMRWLTRYTAQWRKHPSHRTPDRDHLFSTHQYERRVERVSNQQQRSR